MIPFLERRHKSVYAKNQHNLLVLMMKDNIIKIDWTDEVLEKTVLTHNGEIKNQPTKTHGTKSNAPDTKAA
jgi:NAD(P) transhydrogenase subunit alpha